MVLLSRFAERFLRFTAIDYLLVALIAVWLLFAIGAASGEFGWSVKVIDESTSEGGRP